MNICSELRCPHARKSGCDRFSVSGLCPIAELSSIRDNQYWLFANDNADIDTNQLRELLSDRVLIQRPSKQQLKFQSELCDRYPLIWETSYAAKA